MQPEDIGLRHIKKRLLLRQLFGALPLSPSIKIIAAIKIDKKTGAPHGNGKGGAFSVVLHGVDSNTGKEIAIKFFDPDRDTAVDKENSVRFERFKREPDLMQKLAGAQRCLQLVDGFSGYDVITVSENGSEKVPTTCYYYVTEWAAGSVDEYFDKQDEHTALEKLQIFRQCVLAVQALHQRNIAHRDLKTDNLKSVARKDGLLVVAIDFGTAVDLESPQFSDGTYYGSNLGWKAMAPPEALNGLAILRHLAMPGDIYALGCMFYQLFHPDEYALRLYGDSGYRRFFDNAREIMKSESVKLLPIEGRLLKWHEILEQYRILVVKPTMTGDLSSLPPSLNQVASRFLAELVDIDYRKRISRYDKIIRYIDVCIAILGNAESQQRRIKRVQARREDRLRKERERESRLLISEGKQQRITP